MSKNNNLTNQSEYDIKLRSLATEYVKLLSTITPRENKVYDMYFKHMWDTPAFETKVRPIKVSKPKRKYEEFLM